MISLEKINIKFKNQPQLLADFSHTIKKGQIVALLGPSGSGKSTILNLIAGLVKKDISGKITINNKDIGRLSDQEMSNLRNQKIGIIFQDFQLSNNLSVIENVLLPTYFNKSKKKSQLAIKLLNEVGLSNKLKESVKNLSGGQKQRVAIARALINTPDILLADEPTGNLDQKTGEQIIKLLKKVQKTHQTTMLITTHDENVAKIADEIIKI